MKHLKHLKHTLATSAFSATSTCCLDEWRVVDAEHGATEWHRGDASGQAGSVPATSGSVLEKAATGRRVWCQWRAALTLGKASVERAAWWSGPALEKVSDGQAVWWNRPPRSDGVVENATMGEEEGECIHLFRW